MFFTWSNTGTHNLIYKIFANLPEAVYSKV